MKKLALFFGVLLVVVAVALGVGYKKLGTIVRTGVEKIGPEAIGAPVTLADVDIDIFGGKAGLDGFVIDNPKGFSDNKAFQLGKVRTQVDIGSVMSDVVVVKSILIDGANITWEGWGGDNHRKIMDNVKKYAGNSEKAAKTEEKSAGPQKKVILDDFLFQNSEVRFVMNGQEVTKIVLPDIHLTGLGRAKGGEEVQVILAQLYEQIFSGMSGAIASNKALLTKSLGELTGKGEEMLKVGQGALEGVTGGSAVEVKKLTDGLGDLLKK